MDAKEYSLKIIKNKIEKLGIEIEFLKSEYERLKKGSNEEKTI